MSRGRAYRRHQLRVVKRRTYHIVRRWYFGWSDPDPVAVGKNASTHCKPCSATWCCGNPRPWYGQTRKEELSALSEREQRREAGVR